MIGGNTSRLSRLTRLVAVAAATGLAVLAGSGVAQAREGAGATPNGPTTQSKTTSGGDTATASAHSSGVVIGTLNGTKHAFATAKLALTFASGSTLPTYCIDLTHELDTSHGAYVESEWANTGIGTANLGRILWVLAHSQPNVDDADVLAAAGVTGLAARQGDVVYAATQAAIWHFSDRFVLGDWDGSTSGNRFNSTQYAAVQKVYEYLTNDANTGQQGSPTLTVAPTTLTGPAGELVGPFTVSTTAASVTLAISGGGQVLGADKSTEITTIANGGQFWIRLGDSGTSTVTATGKGFVAVGRAFIRAADLKTDNGKDAAQKLILAELKPEEVTATATGTVVVPTASPTPTPTASPTVTVPPSPEVSPAGSTQGLANTGASPLPKLIIAAVLLVLGVAMTVLARRRRQPGSTS